MMRPIDALLQALSKAPASQIDASVTERLRSLVGEKESTIDIVLKNILDDSAYAALASDFGMSAMDTAWKMVQPKEIKNVCS